MEQELTAHTLARQGRRWRGTGGLSQVNHDHGFKPAFLDAETGVIHAACYADGQPAPMHLLDGLPEALVVAREPSGRITAVKERVVAGFVCGGCFYTREQAARRVAADTSATPCSQGWGKTSGARESRCERPSDDPVDVVCGFPACMVAVAMLETGWLAFHLSWSLACRGLTPCLWKQVWFPWL